jgi:hypothetical protein
VTFFKLESDGRHPAPRIPVPVPVPVQARRAGSRSAVAKPRPARLATGRIGNDHAGDASPGNALVAARGSSRGIELDLGAAPSAADDAKFERY